MNSLQNSVGYDMRAGAGGLPFCPADPRRTRADAASRKRRAAEKAQRQSWLCCILYGLLADSPLAVLLPFGGFALGALCIILRASGHSLLQLLPLLGMAAAVAAAVTLICICCCVLEDRKGRYPDFLKSLTMVYTVVGLVALAVLFLLLGHI